MGKLADRMTEDLVLRRFTPSTIYRYMRCARAFVRYHMRSPDEMGEAEVRAFLLHLARERKLGPAGQKTHVAALKFLYKVTLQRPEVTATIPWPKTPQALPAILSGDEMDSLLDAVASIKYRAIIMTAYGCGLRISEACRLQLADVDSHRMLIHVRNAKGARDRYVTLGQRVLFLLRRYWREERIKGPQLFPGCKQNVAVSPSAVRNALQMAARSAKISKRVTPHCLRHSFATHLLELGTDLRVIQMLLGHRSIRSTVRYVRVTDKHVARVTSPVDVLGTPAAEKLG